VNYYNEFDHKTACWLRELIKAGEIPPGEVDERSIVDVQPGDLRGFTQFHFFAGIGGWSYALKLAGWPESEPVWTGSCPCQPFSSAGEQVGTDDPRHLWSHFLRLIKEYKPGILFGEQVKAAIGFGWLDAVLSNLEAEGYSCGASVLGAHSAGFDQIRQRIYFAGHSDPNKVRLQRKRASKKEPWSRKQFEGLVQADLRLCVSTTKSGGLSYGLPSRMVQLSGFGNAIVPQVAAEFIQAYLECL
jgi:DNA (cytosine-5)-methyltransferase 1